VNKDSNIKKFQIQNLFRFEYFSDLENVHVEEIKQKNKKTKNKN
jgi:hypothetical protein